MGTNNWDIPIDIELYYDRGDGMGKQCQSLNSLTTGSMFPNTLAATCDPKTQMAEIEVFIHSEAISFVPATNKCGTKELGCLFVSRMACSTDVVVCNDIHKLGRNLGVPEIDTNRYLDP